MTGKRIWKVVFALMIVVGLVLGGIAIYRAGFTHGAMTSITLPEDSGFPARPFVRDHMMPFGYGFGPRAGLLGLFPLLCFGGFFFLLLMGGFGFIARKRAWMRHCEPGAHPANWQHHGPPPPGWNSGKPPWAEDQSQTESNSPPTETEEPEV